MGIVTEEFFRFDVNTRLEISFPKMLEAPAFSLCFPFPDLMDLQAFNRKYGSSFKRPLGLKDRMKMAEVITMGDLFNMTVRLKQLMHSCVIHIPADFGIQRGNSSACQVIFEMKRFRVGEYVCTMFHPVSIPLYFFEERFKPVNRSSRMKNNINAKAEILAPVHDALSIPSKKIDWTFDIGTLSYAMSYGSTFYEINLKVTSPGILDTDVTRFVIHTPSELPFQSFTLSPFRLRKYSMYHIFPHKKGTTVREMNRFVTTFSRVTIHKLPYPYASKCRENYSKNKCITTCIQERFAAAFNKLPFQMIIEESTVAEDHKLAGMRLISNHDLKDEAISEKFNKLENDCLTSCCYYDCFNDYTMTRVFSAMGLDQSIATFTVATPDEPYVSLISNKKMPANDYLHPHLLTHRVLGRTLGSGLELLRPFSSATDELRKRKLDKKKSGCDRTAFILKQEKRWYCPSDSQAVEESC